MAKKNNISPFDYGLKEAKTGVDRYYVLLKSHSVALKEGVNVDYSGIDTIKLEIPEKPTRIPLTKDNDFKGCVIVIKNTSKDTYLFDKKITGTPIEFDKRLIDKGDFKMVDSLKSGRCLLWIEDENLWVANRRGHSYGHTRRDILLLENGKSKNSVVMPYNNSYSKPACKFVHLDNEPLVFTNLTIERDPGCTFLTHITLITGNDDVRIKNVTVHTPVSKLQGDRGFLIRSCTNVSFEDVRIEGSYSQKNHSGYGIFLDNVWNFKAKRLYGKANWGIFGNNNINTARIEDSQINRFDIHCYGRDVSFKNVEFFDFYNQYSSVYGTILHDKCTFTNFIPVLNEESYNSYVKHEVIFNECVFNSSPDNHFIFKISGLNEIRNTRHELIEKCLPNVSIRNMTINVTGGAKDFYLFYFRPTFMKVSDIGFISRIYIDGLSFVEKSKTPICSIYLSNVNMQTKRPVSCTLKNFKILQDSGINDATEKRDAVVLKANIPIKGGKIKMKNAENVVYVRGNQLSLLCFSINRVTIYPIIVIIFLTFFVGSKKFYKKRSQEKRKALRRP